MFKSTYIVADVSEADRMPEFKVHFIETINFKFF